MSLQLETDLEPFDNSNPDRCPITYTCEFVSSPETARTDICNLPEEDGFFDKSTGILTFWSKDSEVYPPGDYKIKITGSVV